MLPWKISVLILCILFATVLSSPMVYKKNENDKYEPDLIPVSSTVIPLTVYEVSYGVGGKPSEEYKEAYLKHIHKKVKITPEDPDTLITAKKKYFEKKEKEADIKSV